MTMAAKDIREEDIMTDYQFRTIIKMVLAIAEETNDVSVVIEKLKGLLPPSDKEQD